MDCRVGCKKEHTRVSLSTRRIMKLCYYEVCSVGTNEELKTILALLNPWDLTVQQGLFKLGMKSNCDVAMIPP